MTKEKWKSLKNRQKSKKVENEPEVVTINIDPRYDFLKDMICGKEHKALFEGIFGRKK